MKTSGKWKARRDESNLWGGVFCPKVNFVGVFGFIFYEKIKTNRLGTTCQLHVSPHPRAHNPTAINPMTERNHHQDNEESRRAKKKKSKTAKRGERWRRGEVEGAGASGRTTTSASAAGSSPRTSPRPSSASPAPPGTSPPAPSSAPSSDTVSLFFSSPPLLAISSLFVDDLI